MMLTYMICHMVGVSSSVTNPVLYGFLNDNFVKEFQLLCPILKRITLKRTRRNEEIGPNENIPPSIMMKNLARD